MPSVRESWVWYRRSQAQEADAVGNGIAGFVLASEYNTTFTISYTALEKAHNV